MHRTRATCIAFLALAGTHPCRAADAVAAFDAAVAKGLPARIELSAEGGGEVRSLDIERTLNVMVDFPGQPTAPMYQARLDGRRAAVTRAMDGFSIVAADDDGGLDVLTVPVSGPLKIVHRDGIREGTEATGSRRSRRSSGTGSPFVRVAQPGDLALADTGDVQPLRLFFLLHDDLREAPGIDELAWMYGRYPAPASSLAETIDDIHNGYVAWWLTELERDILPAEPIRVVYKAHLPGLTDVRYGTASSLSHWYDAMATHASRHGLPWETGYRNKFILVVSHEVAPRVAGKAHPEGPVAMASLAGGYAVIAHETGHLLGADHEDADVRFEGLWWCQTTMSAAFNPFLGHCYAYTDANRARIRDYYHGGPGRPRAQGVAMPEADD